MAPLPPENAEGARGPAGRHTPERPLRARVRVWHKWTVNRHEKKLLTHVTMKSNHTVVDVALKRSFGHLESHAQTQRQEELRKSTERPRNSTLPDLSQMAPKMKKTSVFKEESHPRMRE